MSSKDAEDQRAVLSTADLLRDVSRLYNKIDTSLLAGDNGRGMGLALFSGLLIGSSFIIKKKGLQVAALSGVRAGDGGYSYLREPLWWSGMLTMILGELANFTAYAYAPAILVTPLGAGSIIVTAVLADVVLKEKMHVCGSVGCILCVLGSILIILFAPEERIIQSVEEIWMMATAPAFASYATAVGLIVFVLIFYVSPHYGDKQVIVYISICSLMGSIGVMSVKALGISLKLTFIGSNQFGKWETYVFAAMLLVCTVTQMNYLNKALDTYNTAIVSSIYYVFFTVLTIAASVIMYRDWERQTANQISSELIGFVLIVVGVFVLHGTKDAQPGCEDGFAQLLGNRPVRGGSMGPLRAIRDDPAYVRVHTSDADLERRALLKEPAERELAPVPASRRESGTFELKSI